VQTHEPRTLFVLPENVILTLTRAVSSKKRLILLLIGAVIGAAAVGVWLTLAGGPGVALDQARGALAWIVEHMKELGPVGFYAVMAALTTVGAPVSIFIVAGGAAFGKLWGVCGGLAALVLSAVAAQVLCRYLFESPLRRLLAAAGRTIPKVAPESHRAFALVIRITPGPPFVVQNYVLSLGGIPLRINLACMVPIQILYVSGFVFLGDAFTKGNFGRALIGVALLAAGAAVVHLLRKRHANRIPTQPAA
jgi:uncharacterized membrane protein YdjX (TVP38/TMEM64 family)